MSTEHIPSPSYEESVVSVLDVLGKEVYHYKGAGNIEQIGVSNFTIPPSTLSGGGYFVRINAGGRIFTGKFTVVR
jgi:hypothetical protein